MQELGRYVFESVERDAGAAIYQAVCRTVLEWLRSKGFEGKSDFELPDGKTASIEQHDLACSQGESTSWKLLQEIEGGFFETGLTAGREGLVVTVFVALSAGHGTNRIAPLQVEARCPGVVSRILELAEWKLGPTRVSARALVVDATDGGRTFVKVISDPERTLPIVAISGHHGLILKADFPARLARDLTGLALVTVLDDEASWYVTSTVGKHLSCFGGAIRLYWPGFKRTDDPFKHPLWTAQRLLERNGTTDAAVAGICQALRRRLMWTSVSALAEPASLRRLRHADASERAAAARKTAADDADYRALAASYAETNELLQRERDSLENQVDVLRREVYRLQTEAVWADAGDDQSPDEAIPPATVGEAIQRVRLLQAGVLTFGDDVERGVAELVPNAGPPQKIFDYLMTLGELSALRRLGPVGKSTVQWLGDRNVDASTESETISNSKTEMLKRTWHDGRGRRPFSMHLKPKESAHPDQCVRIYFEWDEPTAQFVVGWVGRHP